MLAGGAKKIPRKEDQESTRPDLLRTINKTDLGLPHVGASLEGMAETAEGRATARFVMTDLKGSKKAWRGRRVHRKARLLSRNLPRSLKRLRTLFVCPSHIAGHQHYMLRRHTSPQKPIHWQSARHVYL